MEIKVSVIVPVYKVESFISRCVQTLMEQSLTEVEYILWMMPHLIAVLLYYETCLLNIQNEATM